MAALDAVVLDIILTRKTTTIGKILTSRIPLPTIFPTIGIGFFTVET